MGVAGVFFGVLVGWIIGSQQGSDRPAPAPVAAPSSAQAGGGQPAPPPLDESRASAMKLTAQQNPTDAVTRVQLANMYFDAGRFQESAEWYEAALKIHPKDVNASTDLGIAYYYMNQPDRALQQFDRSLAIDPRHTKTLLNVGIVRAFAKDDLDGAAQAWQLVVAYAPDSAEGKRAQQALESLRSAHPNVGAQGTGSKPSGS